MQFISLSAGLSLSRRSNPPFLMSGYYFGDTQLASVMINEKDGPLLGCRRATDVTGSGTGIQENWMPAVLLARACNAASTSCRSMLCCSHPIAGFSMLTVSPACPNALGQCKGFKPFRFVLL